MDAGGHTNITTTRNKVFSKERMRVFIAFCEALIPSLAVINSPNSNNPQILSDFYKLSASSDGLPQQVAHCMAKYLRPADFEKIEMLLWILSTRLGTLALSGKRSSSSCDYKAFHRLPVTDREKILRNWTLGSPFPALRLPFILLKLFIIREFYCKVDESGRNRIVWPAIDYCGPDPLLVNIKERDECDMILESRMLDMTNITPRGKQILSTELGMKAIPRICTNIRNKNKNKKERIGMNTRLEMKADVVVIGSGCGGSVVAAKLAEKGYKVVVMEKGKYFPRVENRLLEGASSTDLYELGSNLSTDDLSVFIFAGATVGGGSTVNWSASFKTPAHVRREWADPNGQHGLALFESETYSRAMDEVCKRIGVQEEVEGGAGAESLANAMLRKGCEKLGLDVGWVPRNAGRDHLCGWCGMGCKSGGKMSTARTWLVDAANRGALILSGCEARRVKMERTTAAAAAATMSPSPGKKRWRAVGVVARVVASRRNATRLLLGEEGEAEAEAEDEDEDEDEAEEDEEVEVEVEVAAKVVVAACGALWTPPLLRRSGLRNKHIGRHLRLHPVMFSWGYFPDAPHGMTSYRGAIMSCVSRVAANWGSSGYGALLMVPALHPGAFAAVSPWRSGRDSKDAMLRFSKTAYLIAITRDSGEGGRVWEEEEEEDKKKKGGGDLHISYKVSAADREHMLTATSYGLRILAAAGAARIGTANLDGASLHLGGEAEEEAEKREERVREFVKSHVGQSSIGGGGGGPNETLLASAHQMGSCRMGRRPASSAVDPSGETWEANGLFVADTSVFPTASGVNPMVTVQSIALCISQSILHFLQP